MAMLNWSEGWSVGHAPLDLLHKKLVDQLAEIELLADADLAPSWSGLVSQVKGLFDQEGQWMRESQFSAIKPHTLQHRIVLNLLQDSVVDVEAGRYQAVRSLAGELNQWFAGHVRTMDAPLAMHLNGHMHPNTTRPC